MSFLFVGFSPRIMRVQREDIHPLQYTCPYFRLRAPDRCPNRKYGFVTDIESDSLPPGLSEEVVRAISRRKQEPECDETR